VSETLRDILDAAARGVFPPADGRTTVVPQACDRDAGVLSFTAHSVVFTDEDPRWVYDMLAAAPCDALAATMNPLFLAAFIERTGRTSETIDAMLVGSPLPGGPPLTLTEIGDGDHPRIVYARRRRDDVRAWQTDGGVLVLGRGIAGRLEVSVEVDEGGAAPGTGPGSGDGGPPSRHGAAVGAGRAGERPQPADVPGGGLSPRGGRGAAQCHGS